MLSGINSCGGDTKHKSTDATATSNTNHELSAHPVWMYSGNLMERHQEDEKTPIAEQTLLNNKIQPCFTNSPLGSQNQGANQLRMSASPFTRTLTPRVRLGASNTSTPRSNHGESSACSSYFTDTSGTSGISSGTDELHELLKSALSVRQYQSGVSASSPSGTASGTAPPILGVGGSSASGQSLEYNVSGSTSFARPALDGSSSTSFSHASNSTFSSLLPFSELEVFCDNLLQRNKSTSDQLLMHNSASLFSASSDLEDLLMQQHPSKSFELPSSKSLRTEQQQCAELNELQNLLFGASGSTVKSSLPNSNAESLLLLSQKDSFPSLSNLDQLRLLIQNQELFRALSMAQSGQQHSTATPVPTANFPSTLSTMGHLLNSAPPAAQILRNCAQFSSAGGGFGNRDNQQESSGFNFSHPASLQLDPLQPSSPRLDARLAFSGFSGVSNAGATSSQNHHHQQQDPSCVSLSDSTTKNEVNQLAMTYKLLFGPMEQEIEKAAHVYRNSASVVAQRSDAAYHWSGKLPPKNYLNVTFSRKVFLGGVPWEITAEELVTTFRNFGEVSVIWPNRERDVTHHNTATIQGPKGFCYIVFEHELSVKMLLDNCIPDMQCNGAYFRMSSLKYKSKDVQVIPWVVSDSSFIGVQGAKPDLKKTVFVGALHGMITAEALFTIMNDLFGNVVMTALDTDKYKYPIGSGRVIFGTKQSYVRAVTANFVEVRTSKFKKTIQIDPYLEDSMCNNCFYQPGFYFCRSFECFRYFCPRCWQIWHSNIEMVNHKPLRRSFRSVAAPGCGGGSSGASPSSSGPMGDK